MPYTVQLTFDTPASIPIQLGKWLAICEMHRSSIMPSLRGWRSDARVCHPTSIQVLSNGSLRLIFSIWYEHNLRRINFAKTPWIELCDPMGPEVVVQEQVPSWVDGVGEMCAELKAVEVVVGLAELLLTCLETIKTVGCTDRDTLRDCFAHDMKRMPPGSLAWPEQQPTFRMLNDSQVASILELAEQWRGKMAATQSATAAPPQPSLLQERVKEIDAEEKFKLEHAKAMEEARKRTAWRNESLQRRLAEAKEETQKCLVAYTNAYRDRDPQAPPVATERMSFLCASVDEVPTVVAKLMAVCTSGKVGPGQVMPYVMQILDRGRVRVLMHVHRLVTDEVKRVPDWAEPYPAKDGSPKAPILYAAKLPAWDEGGVVAPLAHSVHLAALLHAWFEKRSSLLKCWKQCHAFLKMVTHKDEVEQPTLTEEQQHILLELSEEYLSLLNNKWHNASAERTESPTNVEATEFPKLGASPDKRAFLGRTTYLQSMFAITKPAMREPDLKQLSRVAYLSPYRKDMIWSAGPKAALGWAVHTGTPMRIAAW